jgi:hypothetical protein
MSYHYFAATLPMLQPDAPPPLPPERFLALAREYLTLADRGVLESLVTDAPCAHPFVAGWRRHETQLRNAVARHRASRLGLDPAPWIHPHEGYDVTLERGVAAAFQESDPLRREHALDDLRWRQAGDLAGFDAFAAPALFAYYLRLRIAARTADRSPEKGRARRQSLVDPTFRPDAATPAVAES